MPHMMPMLWTLMFLFSLSFMMLLSSLIYFFYIPKINKSLLSPSLNHQLIKWSWLWY